MIIEKITGWHFDLDSNHENVFMQPYETAYDHHPNLESYLLQLVIPSRLYVIDDNPITRSFNQHADSIDIVVKEHGFLTCKYIILNSEYCYFLDNWVELNSVPNNTSYKLHLIYDPWGSNFSAFTEMSRIYANRYDNQDYTKYSWDHSINRGTYPIFSYPDMNSLPILEFTEGVNYKETIFSEYRDTIEYTIKQGDSKDPENWIVKETENAFKVNVLWRRILVEKNKLKGYQQCTNIAVSYTLGSPWSPLYGDYVVIFQPLAAYTPDTNEFMNFAHIRALYDTAHYTSPSSGYFNRDYDDFTPVYGEYIEDTHVIKMDSTFFIPCNIKTYYNADNQRLIIDARALNPNLVCFGGIDSGDIPNQYLYTGISGAPAYHKYNYSLYSFYDSSLRNAHRAVNPIYGEYEPSSIEYNSYRNNKYPFYGLNPFIHLYIRFGYNVVEFPLLFYNNNVYIEIEPKCGATLYKLTVFSGDAMVKNPTVNCMFVYSNGTWAIYTDKMSALIRNEGLFRINGWLQGKIDSAATVANTFTAEDINIGSAIRGIGGELANRINTVATIAHTKLQRDLDSLPTTDSNNDIIYQDRFFVYTKEYVPNHYTEALIHDIQCKGFYGHREVNIFKPSHMRFDYYEGDPYITWKYGILKRPKDSELIRAIFRKGVTIWYTPTWMGDLDPEEYLYFNKELINKER